MGSGWISYKPARGGVPLSHRDMDTLFEDVVIPGSCARYIRLELTTDAGKQLLEPFLAKTEADLKAHPPCAAIVDLRGNGGGDYTKASHFAHRLPDLVRGRIVLLTDPNTFSAAITTTAFIKQAGGNRVTIVGEPVGDRVAFFAEGNQGRLPNLGLSETYETGKHDYGAPCTDWDVCYWLNWFYPVRVKTLQPDERIPQRFADWNAGRDPALARAIQLAH
jgi:hypothetical protein